MKPEGTSSCPATNYSSVWLLLDFAQHTWMCSRSATWPVPTWHLWVKPRHWPYVLCGVHSTYKFSNVLWHAYLIGSFHLSEKYWSVGVMISNTIWKSNRVLWKIATDIASFAIKEGDFSIVMLVIWVNNNISLIWIKALKGDDFPYLPSSMVRS